MAQTSSYVKKPLKTNRQKAARWRTLWRYTLRRVVLGLKKGLDLLNQLFYFTYAVEVV